MVAMHAELRAALGAGHLAHLSTVNADGSPQTTVVWVGVDGDGVVSAHLHWSKKLRNVRRDPRVSISMQLDGRNAMGLDYYLVIEGSARIIEGGAAALLQRLAHVYLGPGVTFPPMPNPPAGYVLRTTPTVIRGVLPWGDSG